ncbi:MAG TPA: hypothetical protein VFK86_11195 [Bauldia sp.]|nr:hypothetical protein [Bauldia sp.]
MTTLSSVPLGEALLEEFLKPLGISQNQLTRVIEDAALSDIKRRIRARKAA